MNNPKESQPYRLGQYRALLAALDKSHGEQKWEICAFLHDEVLQNLNVANLMTEKLLLQAATNGKIEVDASTLRDIKENISRGIEQTQTLMHGIASPVLKYLGLSAAVHALAERLNTEGRIHVTVEVSGECNEQREDVKNAVFSACEHIIAQIQNWSNEITIQLKGSKNGCELIVSADAPDARLATELNEVAKISGEESAVNVSIDDLPVPGILSAAELCRAVGARLTIVECGTLVSIAVNA